ncbi:MAG: hypothetical protein AB1656_26025 [Candidatus Omnitrophota bacterium]
MIYINRLWSIVCLLILAGHNSAGMEPAYVALPESDIVLYSGGAAAECIAVGKGGAYFLRDGLSKQTLRGEFSLYPRPAMNADGTLLALLAKNTRGNASVVLFHIPFRSTAVYSLSQAPSAWAWAANSPRLAIAIEDVVFLLDAEKGRLDPLSFRMEGSIKELSFSPSGENLLLTSAMKERGYTRISIAKLNGSQPVAIEDYSEGGVWLDDSRIAYISGQGEPDSFIDMQTIEKNGTPAPLPEGRKRIGQMGTPGTFYRLSLAPGGDRLAAELDIFSPSDFFPETMERYSARLACFMDIMPNGVSMPYASGWPQFAWTPNGRRYAQIRERINAKPGARKDASAVRDWEIVVSGDFRPVADRAKMEPKPLFQSRRPIRNLSWNADGELLFFDVGGEGMSKVYFAPGNR